MNFKTRLLALMVVSVFLLSGCEVYQTLYGSAPQEAPEAAPGKAVRIEGPLAKEAAISKQAYAAASATQHDPFKAGDNPLGPFDRGKSLGFTMQQWLAASGIGIYSVDGENAEAEFSFKNLVPSGVYTVWCSRITLPPNFSVVDKPCGAEDGLPQTRRAMVNSH